MTIKNKIAAIDIRIDLLKSRMNGMNSPIIAKLERKKRALQKQN